MKLPDVLNGLLPKKEETKEYFFSLYLDTDAAAVSVWSVDDTHTPKIASYAHAKISPDTWEARIQVIDRLLSAAEDKVGVTKPIIKTVFGMPGVYLTADGNIAEVIRPHLKKLSQMLELTPVGFVPLSQAIAFSLKKNEGVPPSIILIGCSKDTAHVTLFRVGQMTHEDTIDLSVDPSGALEAVLKKRQDGDVLPSRMLVYGGNEEHLEEIRSKLLKHPWPTRTNFLHFPKIELVSLEAILTSVSLAGASEMAHDIGEAEESGVASTVVAQPVHTTQADEADVQEKTEAHDEEEQDVPAGDDDADEEETEDVVDEPVSGTIPSQEGSIVDELDTGEDEVSNVEMVTPESLGFRREDVLEDVKPKTATEAGFERKSEKSRIAFPFAFKIPSVSFGKLGNIREVLGRLPRTHGVGIPLLIGVVGLIVLTGILYYMLPRAKVTVLVASQTVDGSAALSVSTKSTIADSESKIIPGKTQEQSVSGEKTIAVTGKKNIGDPAKGTVTIYNKVTSGRNFAKGTVLTTGGIAFTLDSDVSVASASESIGSITFGKANANVTAKEIGPNGNVSASSEFTIASVSPSSVSARNESAFTGGTSKQVTVVSRADQDALVKALTDELVGQAKQQLMAQAAGERLIDQTIKTEVAEKVFDNEIDEESKDLHGKVTIKVTGISVTDADIQAALLPTAEAKIPSGYSLAPEQTTVTTSNVVVKKDGSITLTAKLTAVALPKVDAETLKSRLTGKSIDEALAILKETQGVSGAEFGFSLTPVKSRLPLNSKNITLTVMVQ